MSDLVYLQKNMDRMRQLNQKPLETKVEQPSFDKWLHAFASIILILYALSHLGFLFMQDRSHTLQNTVFPFLTNWTLYLAVAICEFTLALVCFTFRGHAIASILTLVFIGVLLWYKWAFHFTGGTYCGCLGLFGRLIHVNKGMETLIPEITLMLLFLTAIPPILRHISKKLLAPMSIILICCHASAASTIEISGLTHLQDYNPKTERPYTNQSVYGQFIVEISDQGFKICITNRDKAAWRSEYAYDGTNSYTIGPIGGNIFNQLKPQTNICLGSVEPSGRYISPSEDDSGLAMVWLTYGLSKQLMSTNADGKVTLPLGSGDPRHNPGAYGYAWHINFSDTGRFAKDFEIVRDASLDGKDDEAELFRDELNYPETLQEKNSYIIALRNRQETPSGFVKERYKCQEWFVTNGFSLPARTHLDVFLTPAYSHRFRSIELTISNVVCIPESKSILPAISTPTIIQDFRYKKRNESRIFKYAEYKLQPGEAWKSGNDPELLAQAEAWLKHGRKYNDYAGTRRIWEAWLLLTLIVAPGAAILWVSIKKTNKNNKK